eukprot:Skav203117  [mRNA]  locus=scaffold447:577868:583368:+ [translate_table: standard]
MASMLGGMGDAMKEQAKKKVEDELADKAPATLKPLFPCCGGPVKTMETCICMVPADQQDSVKSAIEKCQVSDVGAESRVASDSWVRRLAGHLLWVVRKPYQLITTPQRENDDFSLEDTGSLRGGASDRKKKNMQRRKKQELLARREVRSSQHGKEAAEESDDDDSEIDLRLLEPSWDDKPSLVSEAAPAIEVIRQQEAEDQKLFDAGEKMMQFTKREVEDTIHDMLDVIDASFEWTEDLEEQSDDEEVDAHLAVESGETTGESLRQPTLFSGQQKAEFQHPKEDQAADYDDEVDSLFGDLAEHDEGRIEFIIEAQDEEQWQSCDEDGKEDGLRTADNDIEDLLCNEVSEIRQVEEEGSETTDQDEEHEEKQKEYLEEDGSRMTDKQSIETKEEGSRMTDKQDVVIKEDGSRTTDKQSTGTKEEGSRMTSKESPVSEEEGSRMTDKQDVVIKEDGSRMTDKQSTGTKEEGSRMTGKDSTGHKEDGSRMTDKQSEDHKEEKEEGSRMTDKQSKDHKDEEEIEDEMSPEQLKKQADKDKRLKRKEARMRSWLRKMKTFKGKNKKTKRNHRRRKEREEKVEKDGREDMVQSKKMDQSSEESTDVPADAKLGKASSQLPLVDESEGEEDDIIEGFIRLLEQHSKPDLRGGALGSHTTNKKRQLKELMNTLQTWIEDTEDGEEVGQMTQGAMQDLLENMKKWSKEVPKKQEAQKVVSAIAEKIGASFAKEGGLSHQSFYAKAMDRRKSEPEGMWTEVKGKGRGKGKLKKKGEPSLPRYDLQRHFPKAEITHNYMIRKALEEGSAELVGQVCICKDVNEITEFQMLAAAHDITNSMLLVSKPPSLEDQPMPKNCKHITIPYVGNLAIVKAVVAQMDGKEPTYKGLQVEEAPIADATSVETLRVLVPLKFVPEKFHQQLKVQPVQCLRLAGVTDVGFKAGGKWIVADGIVTGHVDVAVSKRDDILKNSGKGAVFWSRLTRNVAHKPPVTWIINEEEDPPPVYFAKVQAKAQEASVPMVYRRGEGNDLGIQKAPDELQMKAFAAWGIPGHMSPEMLQSWLEERGWEIAHRPQEPRSLRGPWKVYGKNGKDPTKNDDFSYKVHINGKDRFINLVEWRNVRKPKEEIQTLASKRWFDPNQEMIEATPLSQRIPPTKIDEDDDIEDVDEDELMPDKGGRPAGSRPAAAKRIVTEMAAKSEEVNPEKKVKKEEKIQGGIDGPKTEKGRCRLVDCGGDGNCGWKAISYVLAMQNKGWPASFETQGKVTSKLTKYATTLRTQVTTHLLITNRSWAEYWVADPKWNETTEAGKPATTIEEFEEVLQRPKRYICELGLRGAATVKKCNLVVWEREDGEWIQSAVLQPDNPHSNTPTFGLVLHEEHYYAIHFDKGANGDRTHALRGAGGGKKKDFVTPKKKRKIDLEDDEAMLKSCASSSGSSSDALRTCSSRKSSSTDATNMLKSFSSKRSSKVMSEGDAKSIEHALRTCSPLRKKRKIQDFGNLEHYVKVDIDLRTKEGRKYKEENQVEDLSMDKEMRSSRALHRMKAISWKCPYCEYQVENEEKSTYKIYRHLELVHRREIDRQRKNNEETGRASKRHPLMADVPAMVPFEKMSRDEKKTAFFLCPYCRKGLREKPEPVQLLHKCKKFHLKNCTKAPKDITMQQYLSDACRKLRDTKWYKDRVRSQKETIKKRKIENSNKVGHDAKILDLRMPEKVHRRYILWCKKCQAPSTSSYRFNGCRAKHGDKGQLARKPTLDWWEKIAKENRGSLNKVFKATEIPEEEAEEIRAQIMTKRWGWGEPHSTRRNRPKKE